MGQARHLFTNPQDNVESLLVFADKYDMAVVRGRCCHFLANSTSQMDFNAPLESSRNVLRAASLMCTYGGDREELAPYRGAVMDAVKTYMARHVRRANGGCSCTPSCEWPSAPPAGWTASGEEGLVTGVGYGVTGPDSRAAALLLASVLRVQLKGTLIFKESRTDCWRGVYHEHDQTYIVSTGRVRLDPDCACIGTTGYSCLFAGLRERLLQLVQDPRYTTLVAGELQVGVSWCVQGRGLHAHRLLVWLFLNKTQHIVLVMPRRLLL